MQNYEEHGYSVGFVGVCRHLEHWCTKWILATMLMIDLIVWILLFLTITSPGLYVGHLTSLGHMSAVWLQHEWLPLSPGMILPIWPASRATFFSSLCIIPKFHDRKDFPEIGKKFFRWVLRKDVLPESPDELSKSICKREDSNFQVLSEN